MVYGVLCSTLHTCISFKTLYSYRYSLSTQEQMNTFSQPATFPLVNTFSTFLQTVSFHNINNSLRQTPTSSWAWKPKTKVNLFSAYKKIRPKFRWQRGSTHHKTLASFCIIIHTHWTMHEPTEIHQLPYSYTMA